MIEVNFTLIIQAVNFLIILWFLNRFIFKPVLAHIDEREKRIKALNDDATRLVKMGDEANTRYEESLKAIRHDAAEIVSTARKEAQENQDTIMNDSKEKFKKIIESSREQINNEVKSATESLDKDLKGFGQSLAEKILGRNIQ